MRQNHFKLTVPSPCQQSWEEMTTVSGGRFCTHCQHTVTDISAMDDRELAVLFRSKDHPVCVRAFSGQLNREIPLPALQQRSVYRMAVALGLTLLTVAGNQVQARPLPPLIACGTAGKTADIPEQSTDSDTLKISGRITDETWQPFPGVMVKLTMGGINKGTAYSDNEGAFSLPLPYSMISDGLELHFSSPGYARKRVKVDQVMLKEGASVQMAVDNSINITVGRIMPEPSNYKYKKHNKSKKRSKTASQTK